jgi:hypothetical protein
MVVNLNDIPNTKLDFDLLPCTPPHKLKKSYDCIWKFQLEWATKLPWVEGVLATDGVFHNVRCKVCSTISKKPCLLTPKWDTLMKHQARGR